MTSLCHCLKAILVQVVVHPTISSISSLFLRPMNHHHNHAVLSPHIGGCLAVGS
jgi:hypothetical protein